MLSTDINSLSISSESDPEKCRTLWEQVIPTEQITDLWDVRECFHAHFKRDMFFIVAKEANETVGLLPMCFIEEHDYYGYFPGEIWNGKTWLEQNRIFARDADVLRKMFTWLVDNKIQYYLRYLFECTVLSNNVFQEDEIDYLFNPESFNYSMDEYYSLFSNRSIKSIRKEIDRLYERNLEISCDHIDDFEKMVMLNIERFGSQSYFANNQFVKSFRQLRDYLNLNGYLKLTTVIIDGRTAAVDMGCVYNNEYKLLAGGTHSDFPGVAKLINVYHMQKACEEKYKSVDFLCGDFTWKKMFHLTPRPLFQITNLKDSSGV